MTTYTSFFFNVLRTDLLTFAAYSHSGSANFCFSSQKKTYSLYIINFCRYKCSIFNGPKSAHILFWPSLFLFKVKQKVLSLPGLHSTSVLSFSQQISSYSSLVLCTPVTTSPFAVQLLQPRIQMKMKSHLLYFMEVYSKMIVCV